MEIYFICILIVGLLATTCIFRFLQRWEKKQEELKEAESLKELARELRQEVEALKQDDLEDEEKQSEREPTSSL